MKCHFFCGTKKPTHRYVPRGAEKEVGENGEESSKESIHWINRDQQCIRQACDRGAKTVNAQQVTSNTKFYVILKRDACLVNSTPVPC